MSITIDKKEEYENGKRTHLKWRVTCTVYSLFGSYLSSDYLLLDLNDLKELKKQVDLALEREVGHA